MYIVLTHLNTTCYFGLQSTPLTFYKVVNYRFLTENPLSHVIPAILVLQHVGTSLSGRNSHTLP